MEFGTSNLVLFAQVAATVVTAIATAALMGATIVLARHTKRMADSAAQPHIVATIEPNQWASNHFDLHISNTGNATAYEVYLDFQPKLPLRNGSSNNGTPLQRISVLRPGQSLSAYLCEYAMLAGASYSVTIKWRKKPGEAYERHRYVLNIADYTNYGTLGRASPLVQIAEQLKKLREDWREAASGGRRP